MLAILSPAKNISVEGGQVTNRPSTPIMLRETAKLSVELKKLTVAEICTMMKVSDKIGFETFKRIQIFSATQPEQNSKEALFAYIGEAFQALDAVTLSVSELDHGYDAVRVLSGFYGVLRPLDLIQPYRLEMGLKFPFLENGSLYEFWSNKITSELNSAVITSPGDNVLVNLASHEYFASINKAKFTHRIITPVFVHEFKGRFSTIAIYAKRARGLMTRFILKNAIDDVENLKAFDYDGYYFDEKSSEGNNWVFRKRIKG